MSSMDDILKVLVDSRQQPTSAQGGDPMSDLIGRLLSGGQPQSAPQGGGAQTPGLSDFMRLLEDLMKNKGGQSNPADSDPLMALLRPYVDQLAKKMNIPPEIAFVVISFVVHKLLAHHPTSNRDSNTFDLDKMLQQMSTGRVDPGLLRSSGMVGELSKKTGLDEDTAEQSLQLALGLVGKSVGSMVNNTGKPSR